MYSALHCIFCTNQSVLRRYIYIYILYQWNTYIAVHAREAHLRSGALPRERETVSLGSPPSKPSCNRECSIGPTQIAKEVIPEAAAFDAPIPPRIREPADRDGPLSSSLRRIIRLRPGKIIKEVIPPLCRSGSRPPDEEECSQNDEER